jgi:hypothetical protein
MGMGNSPADNYFNELRAKADAERAARLAGYKSPFRRLLERLRPHRQEPSGDPQNFPGTPSNPGD